MRMAPGRHSTRNPQLFLVTSPSVCTHRGAEAVIDICVAVYEIVFTEKSGGKSQQNQYFGNIANAAQIQYAVIIRGGRTEHESAAFIAMTHTGYKQKAG